MKKSRGPDVHLPGVAYASVGFGLECVSSVAISGCCGADSKWGCVWQTQTFAISEYRPLRNMIGNFFIQSADLFLTTSRRMPTANAEG